MATFSIVTTTEQDAAIARKVKAANAEIIAWNADHPTLPQRPLWIARDYVRAALSTVVDGWGDERNQSNREQLKVAMQDPVKRDAILLAAGITD
jgi:hypothetical protein